jgi:hypothetical protein
MISCTDLRVACGFVWVDVWADVWYFGRDFSPRSGCFREVGQLVEKGGKPQKAQ